MLGIGLAPLLVVLLVLQSRWLDELAVAQREEVRQVLDAGAARIATELQEALAGIEADIVRDLEAFDVAAAPFVAELVELAPVEEVAPGVPSFVIGLEGARWLVVLDVERFEAELFPALVRRALGADALETYGVALVPSGAEAPVLHASAGDERLDATAPDATAEALLSPLAWFDGSGERVDALPQPSFFFVDQEDAEARGLTPLWRVEVRQRSGSLDAAVARARTRSALVGASLLLLLVAGLAFLWMVEQRARRFAEDELTRVAEVSHELRTPLSVMSAAGSNLERGVVTSPQQVAEYGALIEAEALRLGALVDRVLRFSGDADEPPARESVDVRDWIDEALRLCLPWKDRRRFDVAIDVASNATRVVGDRAALTSALQNLVENAIKYGDDGQTVRVVASGGGELRVDVVNAGNGIAPADRRRLFEPFFRGANGRETGVPGHGLGLAVARDDAHAHGGSRELVTTHDEVTVTQRQPQGCG